MSIACDMPTWHVTGTGDSGFDSGKGANTSKGDSRQVIYPLSPWGGNDKNIKIWDSIRPYNYGPYKWNVYTTNTLTRILEGKVDPA